MASAESLDCEWRRALHKLPVRAQPRRDQVGQLRLLPLLSVLRMPAPRSTSDIGKTAHHPVGIVRACRVCQSAAPVIGRAVRREKVGLPADEVLALDIRALAEATAKVTHCIDLHPHHTAAALQIGELCDKLHIQRVEQSILFRDEVIGAVKTQECREHRQIVHLIQLGNILIIVDAQLKAVDTESRHLPRPYHKLQGIAVEHRVDKDRIVALLLAVWQYMIDTHRNALIRTAAKVLYDKFNGKGIAERRHWLQVKRGQRKASVLHCIVWCSRTKELHRRIPLQDRLLRLRDPDLRPVKDIIVLEFCPLLHIPYAQIYVGQVIKCRLVKHIGPELEVCRKAYASMCDKGNCTQPRRQYPVLPKGRICAEDIPRIAAIDYKHGVLARIIIAQQRIGHKAHIYIGEVPAAVPKERNQRQPLIDLIRDIDQLHIGIGPLGDACDLPAKVGVIGKGRQLIYKDPELVELLRVQPSAQVQDLLSTQVIKGALLMLFDLIEIGRYLRRTKGIDAASRYCRLVGKASTQTCCKHIIRTGIAARRHQVLEAAGCRVSAVIHASGAIEMIYTLANQQEIAWVALLHQPGHEAINRH